MLVKDEALLHRHVAIGVREQTRHRAAEWFKQHVALASRLVGEFDPTNYEAQIGNPMTSETLIALIRKLQPDILVEAHPTKPWVTVISGVRGGVKFTGAVWEGGLLPEYSTMQMKEELEMIPLPMTSDGTEIISAGLVPEETKRALVKQLDHIFNDPVKRYNTNTAIASLEHIIDNNPTGAEVIQRRLRTFGRELIRGWRTVLILLAHRKLLTIPQVEAVVRKYGSADRQSYAVKIGKRQEECYI